MEDIIKTSELKNIVPASFLDELKLSRMDNPEIAVYMSDLCRGVQTDYADFYALITDIEDADYVKLTSANVRNKVNGILILNRCHVMRNIVYYDIFYD